jgi:hypothetical protein
MTAPKIPTAASLAKASELAKQRSEAAARQEAARRKSYITTHRAEAVKIVEQYVALTIAGATRQGKRQAEVWSTDWGVSNGRPLISDGANPFFFRSHPSLTFPVVCAAVEVVNAHLAKKGIASSIVVTSGSAGFIVAGQVSW